MDQNTPQEIIANKIVKILTITWKDGHVSHYPFSLLRAGCPCAVCRGGHENMRPEPDPAVFEINLPDAPATQLVNVEAVGTYAISLLWNDGHHEGIYSWNYLRALCPCEQCQKR